MARTDVPTGLSGRRAFEERLAHDLALILPDTDARGARLLAEELSRELGKGEAGFRARGASARASA